jgi:hypothetical protein
MSKRQLKTINVLTWYKHQGWTSKNLLTIDLRSKWQYRWKHCRNRLKNSDPFCVKAFKKFVEVAWEICYELVIYDDDFRIDYCYSLLRNTIYFYLQTKCVQFHFLDTVCHQIKSACASLLINTLCLSNPKLPLLGLLITFENNFNYNLVLIYLYCLYIL